MPNLSKPITILATANVFIIIAHATVFGLVLFLISQRHNFIIPFGPIIVIALSLILAGWAAKLVYVPLYSKASSIDSSMQKILLVLLLFVTAGVLYGVVSRL